MLVDDFSHDPNRPPTSSHSIVGRHRSASGILQQSREKRALGCRVASSMSAVALAKEDEAISGHLVFVRQRHAVGFHDLCVAHPSSGFAQATPGQVVPQPGFARERGYAVLWRNYAGQVPPTLQFQLDETCKA